MAAWLPSWDPGLAAQLPPSCRCDISQELAGFLSGGHLARSPGWNLFLINLDGIRKPQSHAPKASIPISQVWWSGFVFLWAMHYFCKGKNELLFNRSIKWMGAIPHVHTGIHSSHWKFTVSRKNRIPSQAASLSQVLLAMKWGVTTTQGSQRDCQTAQYLAVSGYRILCHLLTSPSSRSIQAPNSGYFIREELVRNECIWRWWWACSLTFCPVLQYK